MFCFHCMEENTLIEDTTTGDLVCILCGSCDSHHVTFGDTLPRMPELNPVYSNETDQQEATSSRTKEKVTDPFMTGWKELSRFVCLDRRDICRFHRATLHVVEKDPTLRFVLPAAVVLAVYQGEAKRSGPKERSERSEPGEAKRRRSE